MSKFKIAAVQMDCKFMDKPANLEAIRGHLRTAAKEGAKLAIFPECIVTGYCFDSKEEAWPYGEPLPGPTTDALAQMCKENDIYAVVGMLETEGSDLYNAAALVGPNGFVASYRKVHLPFLGVDRFTTSGTRPFAVHEIDGMRVGMLICYDGAFPEASRCLMLAGADLIALPTNWPVGANKSADLVPAPRALENHVYFAGVNRIGMERAFKFIGLSNIASPFGEILAASEGSDAEILYATVDVAVARNKHLPRIPGIFELNRTKDRHPELYGSIVEPVKNDK